MVEQKNDIELIRAKCRETLHNPKESGAAKMAAANMLAKLGDGGGATGLGGMDRDEIHAEIERCRHSLSLSD